MSQIIWRFFSAKYVSSNVSASCFSQAALCPFADFQQHCSLPINVVRQQASRDLQFRLGTRLQWRTSAMASNETNRVSIDGRARSDENRGHDPLSWTGSVQSVVKAANFFSIISKPRWVLLKFNSSRRCVENIDITAVCLPRLRRTRTFALIFHFAARCARLCSSFIFVLDSFTICRLRGRFSSDTWNLILKSQNDHLSTRRDTRVATLRKCIFVILLFDKNTCPNVHIADVPILGVLRNHVVIHVCK